VSVYQETDPKTGRKRWRVDVFWEFPDASTKRIRKVSPINTRRGAEQYERDIRNALADGSYGQRRKGTALTFGSFRERFFSDHVAKLKPSTRSAQETIWRVSLLPLLEDMPLDEIDEDAIAKLTREILKRGASPKTVNNALSALRTALSQAYEWRLIGRVPRVRWMKVPQQKFDFFTFEEAAQLIAVGSPMVTVALRTGMRIGELLALDWGDVSLERQQVTVERSVFFEKGEAHEGGTKTGKVRTLALTSEARAALESLPGKRKGYVFKNRKGGQLTRNQAKHVLWGAQRAASIRKTGWHVCRHTFASHLVMRGVDLPTVQRLMGHTTIAMTMKYSHLAPDHLRNAIQALEPSAATAAAGAAADLANAHPATRQNSV
jgi:integrase